MNAKQFSQELERRLLALGNDHAIQTGSPPGAPSYEDYRERIGFVNGLNAARELLEQLNDDIRKGETGDRL